MIRSIDLSYPAIDPVAALRAIDDVLSSNAIDRIYAAKQIARNALALAENHAEYCAKAAALEVRHEQAVTEMESWHAAIAEMKAVSQGDVVLAAAEYDALMARLAEELSSARPA